MKKTIVKKIVFLAVFFLLTAPFAWRNFQEYFPVLLSPVLTTGSIEKANEEDGVLYSYQANNKKYMGQFKTEDFEDYVIGSNTYVYYASTNPAYSVTYSPLNHLISIIVIDIVLILFVFFDELLELYLKFTIDKNEKPLSTHVYKNSVDIPKINNPKAKLFISTLVLLGMCLLIVIDVGMILITGVLVFIGETTLLRILMMAMFIFFVWTLYSQYTIAVKLFREKFGNPQV